MSEWKKVKLGEILDFFNGKAIKVGEGCVPIYGSNGIIGYTNQSLYSNAIIIGRVGAYCGSVVFCNKDFWASDNTIVVKPKDDNNIPFCYYLLSTMDLNRFAGGAAQPLLTQTTLKSLETFFPSVTTQHRIASILSRYDTLIENYQKQIKLLEEAAQRLYKEWFVELRFPGHENTKMVDGLPEGWERKKMVDVSKLKAGGDRPKVFSNEKTEELTVPVFSNGTVNEGLYGYTKIAEVNEPSVTVSARGSIGFTVMRRTPYVPIVRLISIIPINVYVGYLYFYIKGMPLDGNGAAQQQITVPMIKDKEILMPSHLILKVFEENVEPLFIMAETHKNQIRLLTEARDRLLPKVMGGSVITSKLL